MVLELIGTLLVHIARVPFVSESLDRLEAPVDKDAEHTILVSFRHGEPF